MLASGYLRASLNRLISGYEEEQGIKTRDIKADKWAEERDGPFSAAKIKKNFLYFQDTYVILIKLV